MKIENIIVSENSFNSSETYDIIQSNISVINLLLGKQVALADLQEDAMISYYVDYYNSQIRNGGFSQFVYNSRWNKNAIQWIKAGFEKMNTPKNLQYFLQQEEVLNQLSQEDLEEYYESEYFGENKTRDFLNNDAFPYDENLVEINANWLRKHPKLLVMSIDQMYETLENYLGESLRD